MRVEFDIKTPADQSRLGLHIANALLQGRPEVKPNTHTGRLSVVANGPSALNAKPEGPILAVNGVIKVCKPDYWCACDPQEIVTTFLGDLPDITYLVASKCHPKVFRLLEDRTVNVWHVDDYPTGRPSIMSAVSVTLCALSLARYMGFTEFDIYGWDGCYIGGKDHAVSQAHVGDDITVTVGQQEFKTTTSWAAEAQDAVIQLSHADYQVRVHGQGMIGAILRHYENHRTMIHWKRAGEPLKPGISIYHPKDANSAGFVISLGSRVYGWRYSKHQRRWLYRTD